MFNSTFTQKVREKGVRYKEGGAKLYLDLNEVWLTHSNELRVGQHLFHIPSFHQGQPVHGPLSLKDGDKGLLESKSINRTS